MSYASRSGRARTSAKSPRAFGVCDRCGRWYNRDQLSVQREWRGTSIVPLWIFVCEPCYDIPNEQNRALTLPADPVPIWQPRPEQFSAAETDYRSTLPVPIDPIVGIPIPAATALRVTQDCENRITQPIGCPNGLVQDGVMPYNGGIQRAFGVLLDVVSVIADGSATVRVTCAKVHGLKTNDQVSIEGLLIQGASAGTGVLAGGGLPAGGGWPAGSGSGGGATATRPAANGFFSVDVISATAFSYTLVNNVPAGSLLTPTTRIVTALVGLPYGADKIPPACYRSGSASVIGGGQGGGTSFVAGSGIPAGSGQPAGSG